MKHRLKSIKLGKDSKHRKALLRNLATSLLKSERIRTTTTKAKQLRPFVEKLITRAKKDTLHHRRLVYRDIKKREVLKKLFENIGQRYQNRNGGYTRIYKLHQRKGDDAQMSLIELVEEKMEGADDSKEASPATASEESSSAKKKNMKPSFSGASKPKSTKG